MALRTAAAARPQPIAPPPPPRPAPRPPAQLKLLDNPAPVIPPYIADTLGPTGSFAAAFPGYEARSSQLDLAAMIDKAIVDRRNLLGQAPTGTGKSVAYLLPAIRNAVANGARVVVVTANIALQEQLVGKDLPMLQSLLPWPFTFALAKGRGNYLCLDRFKDEQLITLSASRPDEARQWREIEQWASLTSTGDLSELPFEPTSAVRMRCTTTTDDCHGKSCASYGDCHAVKARLSYQAAQVIVTNYHLFFTELQLRRETKSPVLLPDWQVVIFDEAHKAPDIARDFFGFEITVGKLRHAGRLLAPKNDKTPQIDERLKAQLDVEASDFFDRLRVYAQSPEYKARITRPDVVDARPLLSVLHEVVDAYEQVMKSDVGTEVRGKLERAQRKATILADNIECAMKLWAPEKNVYFVQEDHSGRVSLCAKLIHVGASFQRELYKPGVTIAAVSATLTTGGNFSFAADEFGMTDKHQGLQIEVESPFDYRENALLVVPRDMPDPTDKKLPREAYNQACARRFTETVHVVEGRTLGLFTSFKALDEAHRTLLASGWQGRVLRQGEAPRTQLIREFKEDVRSVLLGTDSFWEGVDVPGESLSCVVIDRLPFPTPDDPVLDAVSAIRGKEAFFEWSIPRAVIKLTQGFGRLIRTRTDRGVVVVLDRRITDKSYGSAFLRSLPFDLRVSRDFADVGRFLAASSSR